MNLIYDIRLDCLLCPKCNSPAHQTKEGLVCEWEECGYIYTMFAENKPVNYFQLDLFKH